MILIIAKNFLIGQHLFYKTLNHICIAIIQTFGVCCS